MSGVPPELLALLQLGRRAREAASAETLGFTMANETRQLFAYRQAAFWLGGKLGRVAAVSGLPQVESNAPYVQWLGELCALQDALAPTLVDPATLPPLTAERWGDWLPAHALWLPLLHAGQPQGGLLFAADEPFAEHTLGLAAELADSYAHALAALAPRRTLAERAMAALKPTRRRLIALAVLAAVALCPVRQSVLAPAEVVALEPFIVRAPLDGVIDRLLVQPNQPVKAGMPLFAMDTTALQTRRDVASKAYDAAQEEFRISAQAAVTDDKSKRDVALRRGELEEKGVELSYAADQLGRVQVSAERDGLAVFADANDWPGRVVTLGERILLLADPAKVALAIDMPAGEHLALQPGMAVTLHPNADPLSSFDARITQIAYSAEPARDGVLAYRLKAEFVLADGQPPRIGLMGMATLEGTRVPLLYYALRRPLTAVRQWLGW
ncbi:efflux RND transporter periplasmic adaptor subunit [Roseateles sp. P5_E8]